MLRLGVTFRRAAAVASAAAVPLALTWARPQVVSTEGVPSFTGQESHAAPQQPTGSPWAVELNRLIDHTLLKPEARPAEVEKLVEEAVLHQFASVCVNGALVSHARGHLDALGSGSVKVCAVVGFPLGAMATEIKAAEAERVRGVPCYDHC
jgi:hypothetical protein